MLNTIANHLSSLIVSDCHVIATKSSNDTVYRTFEPYMTVVSDNVHEIEGYRHGRMNRDFSGAVEL